MHLRRTPLVRALATLGLAAALGACATQHRAPDLALPSAYEAPAGQASVAEAELDKWWLLFGDPALNALEDDAFRLSPDARTAAARLMEAKATRESQTAQTFPTGALVGNASRKHTEDLQGNSNNLIPTGGDTTTETLNFNVSWELDLFGRLATARKIAKADFAATRFNVEGARAALAANVADAYFQVRGLTIQLADAEETARIQGKLLELAKTKAARGLGPASDADR